MQITKRNSCFIRFRGLFHRLGLSPHETEVLAIKLEIDTNPPAHATLAQKQSRICWLGKTLVWLWPITSVLYHYYLLCSGVFLFCWSLRVFERLERYAVTVARTVS